MHQQSISRRYQIYHDPDVFIILVEGLATLLYLVDILLLDTTFLTVNNNSSEAPYRDKIDLMAVFLLPVDPFAI